jgi:2-alkyl-3-oxoalkanoate reductase
MKIMVTGASGFIGGEVTEYLATKVGLNIIAMGRSLTNRFDAFPNVEFIQADLTRQIPSFECEVCIHCAGLADDRATEEEFMRNNVLATEHLIDSLTGCKKLIFISSSSVYDFSDGNPKREEDASLHAKLSTYGKSKLLAESKVAESGIASVFILRPRAVYGKNDRVLMPRIKKLIKGKIIFAPGKLEVNTSLTHIKNLIEAVNIAVSVSKSGIHIYNVADKNPYLLKSVFEKIGVAQTGGKVRFVHLPLVFIKSMISLAHALGIRINFSLQSLDYLALHSIIDTSKIQKELAFHAKYEFFRYFPGNPFHLPSTEHQNA